MAPGPARTGAEGHLQPSHTHGLILPALPSAAIASVPLRPSVASHPCALHPHTPCSPRCLQAPAPLTGTCSPYLVPALEAPFPSPPPPHCLPAHAGSTSWCCSGHSPPATPVSLGGLARSRPPPLPKCPLSEGAGSRSPGPRLVHLHTCHLPHSASDPRCRDFQPLSTVSVSALERTLESPEGQGLCWWCCWC